MKSWFTKSKLITFASSQSRTWGIRTLRLRTTIAAWLCDTRSALPQPLFFIWSGSESRGFARMTSRWASHLLWSLRVNHTSFKTYLLRWCIVFHVHAYFPACMYMCHMYACCHSAHGGQWGPRILWNWSYSWSCTTVLGTGLGSPARTACVYILDSFLLYKRGARQGMVSVPLGHPINHWVSALAFVLMGTFQQHRTGRPCTR